MWYGVCVYGYVVYGCEVSDCCGSKVYEMFDVYVVWACGVVVFCLFNGAFGLFYGDCDFCMVKFFGHPVYSPIKSVCGVCDGVSEWFVEMFCFGFVICCCFVMELYGCIRCLCGFFV